MTPNPCRRVSTLRTFCLLAALASAALVFAQAPATTPAKLVVKNAFILTMAPGQHEPVKGYLVVGEDGRLLTVAARSSRRAAGKAKPGCRWPLGDSRLYFCP